MKNSLNVNIRQLRLGMGLNQVEFARKMNVTKQCVSNWENDNVQPSIEMLTKLADFFKVSTDFLLGRSESKAIDVSELSDEQIAHIRLLVKDFGK
ncbi:MAG: helix-turn-helix transcriptional regulator [Clostridia bacterium]|nr:helix-turn-helix transcriptional regulator [Clostridia bacterium]